MTEALVEAPPAPTGTPAGGPADDIPATRRVERAIACAYGQPVATVLAGLAGRSLDEMRLELGRAIGDTVFWQGPSACRVVAGGRRFIDETADFEQARILEGDCLVMNTDRVPRPIVARSATQLLLDQDQAIPPAGRSVEGGYRIVRPWRVSQWAVRCLCRRHGVRPVRADHVRARNRGRHQQAVQRVFRLPFERYTDNLLFAAEGVDYVTGARIAPVDILARVESTVAAVYAHPRLAAQRKNLRTAILRALAQRSQSLTLSFHLRADLPESLMDLTD